MDRIDTFQIGDDGPWSRVALRDGEPRSTRIVARLCLFGRPRQWWIEQRALPFFRAGCLLRADFTAGVHGCRIHGVEGAAGLVRLDDEASYEEAMRIGDAEVREDTAEAVLRFHFHPRIFAGCRIHLVERADDVAWNRLAGAADRQAVDAVARCLMLAGCDRGAIRFSATVKIERDLFAARGRVDPNGSVSVDVQSALLRDLPCAVGRWCDPARYL